MTEIENLPARVACLRGDEIDVVNARPLLKWRSGETGRIKTRMRRRDRRFANQVLRFSLKAW